MSDHRPLIAPSAPEHGGWGVYCLACSEDADDYVWPCSEGRWMHYATPPPQWLTDTAERDAYKAILDGEVRELLEAIHADERIAGWIYATWRAVENALARAVGGALTDSTSAPGPITPADPVAVVTEFGHPVDMGYLSLPAEVQAALTDAPKNDFEAIDRAMNDPRYDIRDETDAPGGPTPAELLSCCPGEHTYGPACLAEPERVTEGGDT